MSSEWEEGSVESTSGEGLSVKESGGTAAGGHPMGGAGEDDAGDLYGEPWAGELWTGSPAGSTNRQGANRQDVASDGGEDTADWGWLVQWSELRLEEMREKFGRAQKAAQADDVEGSVVRIGQSSGCLVRPSGCRVGGLYFSWVVEVAGCRLTIMDRPGPSGETPNVRVHVGALSLLYFDLAAVHESMRYQIEQMGGTITGEKLSRVDACLDLVDVPVTDFVGPFLSGQVVRRGRKCGVYLDGLSFTGFHVGQGVVRLRVYDKVAECQKDAVKWDAMVQMRWDGEVPEIASRVEFQLRRKALKEFAIETVADWIQKRAAVLDYLTGQWFRLTDGQVDRENSQRCGPSSLWGRVSEGFSSWAGFAVVPAVRERLKRKVLGIAALYRQGVGCLTSAAAVRGVSIVTFSDVVRFFCDQAAAFEEEIERGVVERYREKRVSWDQALCAVAGG